MSTGSTEELTIKEALKIEGLANIKPVRKGLLDPKDCLKLLNFISKRRKNATQDARLTIKLDQRNSYLCDEETSVDNETENEMLLIDRVNESITSEALEVVKIERSAYQQSLE